MSKLASHSILVPAQKAPLIERVMRSGLDLEYFIKANSTVNIGGASPVSCGIVYDTSIKPHLLSQKLPAQTHSFD